MSGTDAYCCHACVSDPFLKARIQTEGEIAECAQCGETGEAVTEFDLGQWIEVVLERHFEPGEGDEMATIIEDIAGVTSEFAQEVADSLGSLAGYIASGGETFYDSDEGYVVIQNLTGRSLHCWERFTSSVRAEARFFNREAEEWLDYIFGPLTRDRTWRGQEVITTMPAGGAFFRARHVASVPKAGEILKDPAGQLGPRPNGSGSPGRMNAAGVSVFYGALDVETCIAEIRPPVGALVVSGRFELVRPLRLLDFDQLEMVVAKCSHFDPDYDEKMERALFLRAFGRKIAQPVMPDDEAFGYLPAQIVADFLAQRSTPPLDGLLYRSTQTGGRGRNVVLFHHRSRVVATTGMPPAPPTAFDSFDPSGALEPVPGADRRAETLKVDPASLEITDIRAVDYDKHRRSVEIWNIELHEREWYPGE